MYHTKAFWGLEDNPNANYLNTSFNVVPNLTSIIFIVVFIIALILIVTTKLGFG